MASEQGQEETVGSYNQLTGRELGTDDVAEEEGARSTGLLLELRLESLGDGVGARVDVTGEEDSETLLLLGGVRFPENLDDGFVREPVGDRSTLR